MNVRRVIAVIFLAIFAAMLAFTVRASLARSVFDNGHLIKDAWFQATLLDAYLGFLTFYLWVVWKERSLAPRLIWFVLIMVFGNIAMSGYVLLQLFQLPKDASVAELLTHRTNTLGVGNEVQLDQS